MSVECFVTGGSGFIGQHLLARLTFSGHKVWVLMRHAPNLETLREQVRQLGENLRVYMPFRATLTSRNWGSMRPTASASPRPAWYFTSPHNSPGACLWTKPARSTWTVPWRSPDWPQASVAGC